MKTILFKIAILLLLVSGCDMYNTSAQYTYRSPEKINDGMEVGTLEETDMDVRAIEEAVNGILGGRYSEVHSMLIYKDGKLVLEEYFSGHEYQWDGPYHHGEWVNWDREMNHHLMSSTKSVTSALIGIAIDQGFIESVHQSIFDYLPDHRHMATGGKEAISIEYLLAMTSGLDWREWSAPYSSGENPCIGIWFQEKDPISFILGMPLVDRPGTNYNYSTGNMVVLGEILRNATSLGIDMFSEKYLFEPLGIDSADWALQYDNGVDANNLRLTPRAMTKIGATFANNGVWNGKRIVSEDWVEQSANPYRGNKGINIPGEPSGRLGYSYSWWTKMYPVGGKSIHMYAAGGFGGQHIMILPEVNTVVVFTGGNFLSRRPPFKILKKYIIPALD
ncbi:MAG: serine hydrolase [Bacteroidota bacterium]|nr:serine hydrolase [Bacteroidota bacterium]